MKPLTETQARERLRKACTAAGGQSAWAKTADLSPQFVGDVLLGRRNVTPAIARALGLRLVVMFEPEPDFIASSSHLTGTESGGDRG